MGLEWGVLRLLRLNKNLEEKDGEACGDRMEKVGLLGVFELVDLRRLTAGDSIL